MNENTVKLSRIQVGEIETFIRDHPHSLKRIKNQTLNLIFARGNNDENTGSKKIFSTKSRTEKIAIELADNRFFLGDQSRYQAIQHVYEKLPEIKQKMIQLRYWSKPHTWEEIARELYISKRQAIRWRDSFVEEIYGLLYGRGKN